MLAALVAALAAVLVSSACSTGEPASPAPGAEPLPTPTYHRDVAPILAHRCTKCHYEGGLGPFALTSYELARNMAPAMNAAVAARLMPPWGAHDTDECQPPLPWRDDERLSDAEIETLQRWETSGLLEGDPKDNPGIARVQSLDLPTATLELAPRVAYVPTATKADEFRCFVLEGPALEAGGYLSAVHVIAGNRRVVHHVSVYADRGGLASKRAGPDGSFDCASGAHFRAPEGGNPDEKPQLSTVYAWAPGARPLELPANVGIQLPPQSKLIMEIHYSTGGQPADPDSTRIQLTLGTNKPEYIVSPWGVGNYSLHNPNGDGLQPGPGDRNGTVEFRIPANVSDHTETMQATFGIEGPLPILGFRPHAHLAAVDVKVEIIRDGAAQCLIQDRWDFHWQRTYTFDAPIEQLPTMNYGDKVRIRCTFDNTGKNRRLATELRDRGLQPMDIPLGDGSLDEMCLADVLFIKKNE